MTQKRGLGRGLGALIPGAGATPAPEQELRTRVRPASQSGERSKHHRPVDMFFSGDEISEDEAREKNKRAARQNLAEDMARAAAKRRGRGTTGARGTAASKAAAAAEEAAAQTAQTPSTPDDDSAPKSPAAKAPATKTAVKKAPAAKSAAKRPATAKAPAGDRAQAAIEPAPSSQTPAKPPAQKAPAKKTPAKRTATKKAASTTTSTAKPAATVPAKAAPTAVAAEPVAAEPVLADASAQAQTPAVSPEAASAEPVEAAAPAAPAAAPAPQPEPVPAVQAEPAPAPSRETTAEADSTETDAAEASEPMSEDVPARQGLVSVPGAEFAEIPIHEIRENPRNPRTMFDEDELDELAFSLREVGVLQPVVVRPIPVTEEGESFELVMGERRWRAARRAELTSIPAIIRETSDDDLLRDALLENLHRAQLNPLEEANAYQQLLEDFGCTQDELGSRIGRSRPQITNTLRLLRLPALVQRRLASGALSAGHSRALLSLDDPTLMEELAQRIVAEGLSVRAVERLVARGSQQQTGTRVARRSTYDPHVVDLTSRLSNRLETPVKIDVGKRKGKITLEFTNLEDLDRLLESMGLDPSSSEGGQSAN